MTDNKHYRIGLENKCFSGKILIKWVVKSLCHCLLIYLICYQALSDPAQHLGGEVDGYLGKDLGLWTAGHATYCAAVLIANFVMLYEHHTIDFVVVAGQIVAIGSFFLIFWLESNPNIIRFDVLIGVFSILFSQYVTWISIFLSTVSVVLSSLVYTEVTRGIVSELIAPCMPFLFINQATGARYHELIDDTDA